jgi:hypothetical protein
MAAASRKPVLGYERARAFRRRRRTPVAARPVSRIVQAAGSGTARKLSNEVKTPALNGSPLLVIEKRKSVNRPPTGMRPSL